ncbi:MAG: pilus assembly protein N-terminal domain-containing protein, partial [Acidobacteria bacterium]|nr:pilus assembly protein N-terminal domain-containing protein [Acidobacteriota bacterium]
MHAGRFLVLVLFATVAFAEQPSTLVQQDLTLFVQDQQSLVPGYAAGNIAIADPKIADFKVMPGRKELLLFGKTVGQTKLVIWDQKNVKRHEIQITVATRPPAGLELELRDLLKEFPSVEVRQLAGSLVIAGAVSSKDDLAAIEKIAAAAKVKSLVRFVAPVQMATPLSTSPAPVPAPAAAPSVTVPKPAPAPTASQPPTKPAPAPSTPAVKPTPPPAPATPAPATTTTVPAAPPAEAGPQIEYEIELLEASTSFRSGSYATGVEPSGRRLHKDVVRATAGADAQLFIGGEVTSKDKTAKLAASAQAMPTGIRLTLRPAAPDRTGRIKTAVLVETNLPIGSDLYDPNTWRRARWEFTAGSGEPFAITGN